jgi:tetratricopeptide (TPR) repeat protein
MSDSTSSHLTDLAGLLEEARTRLRGSGQFDLETWKLRCSATVNRLADLLQTSWSDTLQAGTPSAAPACNDNLGAADPATPAASFQEPMPLVPGYELLKVLGRGGMGVVYQVRQVRLQRLVALKMIRNSNLAGAEEMARFQTEARAVAQLQHPHIVQIYEVGETDGLPFFSLEYVDGGTLARKLSGNPLPAPAAAQLVETLARAMYFAHERGIIHRDLKPNNVLLTTDGTPKIADFGLAKLLHSDAGQTQSGAILGTPSYMAPEQAAGQLKVIGPTTDVYALGAILYEVITGRPPFRAATVVETMEQVRLQDLLPPSQLQPRLPRDLETICLKCLEKDRAKRYLTAQDLADDLLRFLQDRPIHARPATRWEQFWKFARRNRTLVGGLAGILVALLLGITGTSIGLVRAVHAGQRAAQAETSLAAELTHTRAAAAELEVSVAKVAQQRGQWQSALDHYAQALHLGYEDEIALRLEMIKCRNNLGGNIVPEVDALGERPDLGKHRASYLLIKGRVTFGRSSQQGNPVELIRQALALGLSPEEAAIARGYLAETIPEALAHFQQARRLNPFCDVDRATEWFLCVLAGRLEEAKELAAQAQLAEPNGKTPLLMSAMQHALEGDSAKASTLLTQFEAHNALENPEVARLLIQLLPLVREEGVHWGDLDANQGLSTLRRLQGLYASSAARRGVQTDKNALFAGQQVDQLPFLKKYLAQIFTCVFKKAIIRSVPLTEIQDLLRMNPDGMTYGVYASSLEALGRLQEAEEAYVKACQQPSLLNCRRFMIYRLANLQFKRASAARDAHLKARAVENLHRAVAVTGPLTARAADALSFLALDMDEYNLALNLLDQWQRLEPGKLEIVRRRALAEHYRGSAIQALTQADAVLKRAPRDQLALTVRERSVKQIKDFQKDLASRAPVGASAESKGKK